MDGDMLFARQMHWVSLVSMGDSMLHLYIYSLLPKKAGRLSEAWVDFVAYAMTFGV